MRKIDIPIVVGPGSQPADEDGQRLDYLQMPSGMSTYSTPSLPEPDEVQGVEDAIALLRRVQAGLAGYRVSEPALVLPLAELDETNTALINQVLGDGEVSVTYVGAVKARVQESVLAGVWRVQYLDDHDGVQRDVIEVATIPSLVTEATFTDAAMSLAFDKSDVADELHNAAPLLTEIGGKLASYRPDATPHVINLSLLPHSEEDIELLNSKLGVGPVVILSRGYGNCRITSTSIKNVWWVQYFNSQDTLILNAIEISEVPDVACAAQEDIDDSAQRLFEILEIYR